VLVAAGLLLLAACAALPLGGGRGGSSLAVPEPEVIKEYPWMAGVRWPPDTRRPSDAEQLEIAADIDTLLTAEFDEYPEAGRRLIEHGETVIPCLGQAAQRHPAPAVRKERLKIVFRPVLAELAPERVLIALASPYPAVRAAAAWSAGDRGLEPLGLRLIELLDDPDTEVRRRAIAALRKITGEFLGYRADDSPSARAANAAEWHEFWRQR